MIVHKSGSQVHTLHMEHSTLRAVDLHISSNVTGSTGSVLFIETKPSTLAKHRFTLM